MRIDQLNANGKITIAENMTIYNEETIRKNNKADDSNFKAFISFPTEHEKLGKFIRKFLVNVFPDLHPFFISSAPDCIPAGQDWLKSIKDALNSAKVLFVLATSRSLSRLWINFEIGAAWSKDIPIIFLCYDDLSPLSLPQPYITRQGLSLSIDEPEKCLTDLVRHLTHALNIKPIEKIELKSYSEELKQHLMQIPNR
jgi:hypothetical protein